MRILNVIGWLAPRYGGTTEVVSESCGWLTARGHEVEVITTNVDGRAVLEVPIKRALDWAGVTATFHPLSSPRKFLTSWSLLADLRQRLSQFDIVHIHSLYRFHTIAAATVARRRQVPYVIQAHGSLNPWYRRHRWRAKNAYHFLVEDSNIQGADAVLCTSTLEEQSIRNLGYTVPTWVIPNGVDAEALRAPSDVNGVLARAGVDSRARLVTFLGRISATKGVDLLVSSFREIASTFSNAHLVVAGPDDEGLGKTLAQGIDAKGLTKRVSFVGNVSGSEKRALLNRSDVFVLPSVSESFGIAVAEAMAVGCPVVVSSHVALQDAVHSAGAGLIVDRDPAEVARAVGTILANPRAAAAMGRAGMRVVDQQFTWPRVAAKLESMYEAVVASRGLGQRPRP